MGTSMKKYIVKALKWALNKFEDRTAEIAAWPFPVEQAPKSKRKPRVRKTRPLPSKATVAKAVAKKKTK